MIKKSKRIFRFFDYLIMPYALLMHLIRKDRVNGLFHNVFLCQNVLEKYLFMH
jgi:hypothetical protein